VLGFEGITILANSDEHRKPSAAAQINIPKHVAIIMDGNGRWAKNRFLPREAGHVKGISALRKTVSGARELGVSYLTVYAFSTENWKRPQSEVKSLMGLFRRFYHADMKRLKKENVRVRFIGRREKLDSDIVGLIHEAEQMTEANTGLNLTVAFNYGAREELLVAAQSLARDAVTERLNLAAVDENMFSHRLQTAGFPDVDLVVRPGGEKRISNFLLWQTAYAEFVFLDVLWPDFGKAHLEAVLREYAVRNRRFGQLPPEETEGFSRIGGDNQALRRSASSQAK
jgi:undecaprenyl diphosphate synthase